MELWLAVIPMRLEENKAVKKPTANATTVTTTGNQISANNYRASGADIVNIGQI